MKKRLGEINPSKRAKVRRRLAKGAVWALCQGTCNKKFPVSELTIDHIIPLSSGGTSTETNLQLLCRPCHNLKDFPIGSGRVQLHKKLRRSIRLYMTWLERNRLSNSKRNSGLSVKYLYGAGTVTLATHAVHLTLKALIGTLGTLYPRLLEAYYFVTTWRILDLNATNATSTSAGMVPSTIEEWSPKKGKSLLKDSLPLNTRLSKRTRSGLKL